MTLGTTERTLDLQVPSQGNGLSRDQWVELLVWVLDYKGFKGVETSDRRLPPSEQEKPSIATSISEKLNNAKVTFSEKFNHSHSQKDSPSRDGKNSAKSFSENVFNAKENPIYDEPDDRQPSPK
mmetsp:Transcript_8895/g.15268  ORF Transcript_8895/g.15268 Transcript_8895/m.15268 type:complete len:124 (-) Transcript_8895:100-471(-)